MTPAKFSVPLLCVAIACSEPVDEFETHDDEQSEQEDRFALIQMLSMLTTSEPGQHYLAQEIRAAQDLGEPLTTEALLDKPELLALLAEQADLEIAELVAVLTDTPPTELALGQADEGDASLTLVLAQGDSLMAWESGSELEERADMSALGLGTTLLVTPSGWHEERGGLELSIPEFDQTLRAYAYPQGLTCGLSYIRNGAIFVDGYCGSTTNRTLASILWSGYSRVFTGDFGLNSGQGFYHQSRSYSSGTLVSSSLHLPKGTACGFKHTKNAPNVSCLGYDAAISCPSGWSRRYATDSMSSGGMWAWCEYQDPQSLCTTQTCLLTNVPSGLVCGITHNGESTGIGRCNGIATTTGCPQGWQRRGFYDWGRSSNIGIGWCVRP